VPKGNNVAVLLHISEIQEIRVGFEEGEIPLLTIEEGEGPCIQSPFFQTFDFYISEVLMCPLSFFTSQKSKKYELGLKRAKSHCLL
jgi:hypothetical protein